MSYAAMTLLGHMHPNIRTYTLLATNKYRCFCTSATCLKPCASMLKRMTCNSIIHHTQQGSQPLPDCLKFMSSRARLLPKTTVVLTLLQTLFVSTRHAYQHTVKLFAISMLSSNVNPYWYKLASSLQMTPFSL